MICQKHARVKKNSRVILQCMLEDLLGSRNVYFQPPENIKLKYPCIIYTKQDENQWYADDIKYLKANLYEVVVIDHDPDSCIAEKLSDLPYCTFDRYYASDNLNHFVYRLFF